MPPNEPRGKLNNPLGFDPTGLLRPLEMTVDGYLRVYLENNVMSIPHVLLDGSVHTDTVAGAPVKGDLIIGIDQGGGVIKWQRLAMGSVGSVLTPQASGELAWTTPHVARCSTAAGQVIPNGADTIIDFGTVIEDTHTQVTTGAAWKFTCKLAGLYLVTARIMFGSTATWAAGETGALYVYRNGISIDSLDRKDNYSTSTPYMQVNGSVLVRLALTDYVDIRVYQNSGGNLPLYPTAANNGIEIAYICA